MADPVADPVALDQLAVGPGEFVVLVSRGPLTFDDAAGIRERIPDGLRDRVLVIDGFDARTEKRASSTGPFVVTWPLAREGVCDGCSETKWLIRAYAVDEENEPWLCAECDVRQPGSWRRRKLALDAAVRYHFDVRASVGLSVPYDEISDRTKRIVGDQFRDMVDAVLVALDGVVYDPAHDLRDRPDG